MIGFDVLILAAVLGVGGSLLLAKSNLQPSFMKEITQTFMGSNPYQVRNLTTQRIEAIAGACWLCGSLPLMALGTILTSETNQQIQTSTYLSHIFALVGLGAIGLGGSLKITDRISRRIYLPKMIELQREIFEISTDYLKYRGVREHELPHQQNLSQSDRNERLAQTTEWLNQIGTLIDVPRHASEADDSYLARLGPFFDK